MSEVTSMEDQVRQLADMFPAYEGTLDEFVVHDDVLGWPVLRHPLCCEITLPNTLGAMEQSIRAKEQKIKELEEKKKYGQIIGMHARPYRSTALIRYFPVMSQYQRASMIAWVWRDSENPQINADKWNVLWHGLRDGLNSGRYSQGWVMSKDDQEVLAKHKASKSKVMLFRGFAGKGSRGLSWTTDPSRAEWFAHRSSALYRKGEPAVANFAIDPAHLFIFMNHRNEEEVIVLPDMLPRRLKISRIN